MNNSKRIFYFDALRVMAIIGVIFCHASTSFVALDIGSFNFYISAFFDCFRDFCVPIFVMLSGALLIAKKDSLFTFFKKRLSRIFIPFLFWGIVYTLYSFIFLKHNLNLNYVFDVFMRNGGTIGGIFWFVWMIFTIYIAIFIINKVNSYGNGRIPDFDRKFINVLTILSVVFIIMFQMYLLPDILYKSLLGYYVSFIPYAIIGSFLANNDFISSKIGAKKTALIALALSIATYLYYIFACVGPMSVSNNSFTYPGYFNILILVLSASIFILFKSMSKIQFFRNVEKSKYGDVIVSLSGYSYGIYLIHYLVLYILKRKIVIICDYTQQSPLIWIPLLVLITLIISLAILMILDRIPYLRKVTGNS